MKKLTALLAFAFLAACGPSPEQVCKDSVAADCERMWTCGSSVKVGSDAASCSSSLGALCGLASGSSSTDLTAAQKCTADTKAQSCDAYKAGKPASCK